MNKKAQNSSNYGVNEKSQEICVFSKLLSVSAPHKDFFKPGKVSQLIKCYLTRLAYFSLRISSFHSKI